MAKVHYEERLVSEYILMMPAWLRAKVINNVADTRDLKKTAFTPWEALSKAFWFQETKEGREFWVEIVNDLANGVIEINADNPVDKEKRSLVFQMKSKDYGDKIRKISLIKANIDMSSWSISVLNNLFQLQGFVIYSKTFKNGLRFVAKSGTSGRIYHIKRNKSNK